MTTSSPPVEVDGTTSTSLPTISPLIVRTANPSAPDKNELAAPPIGPRSAPANSAAHRIDACISVRYCGEDSNPAPRAADRVVKRLPHTRADRSDAAPVVEPVTELDQ
jgi:hypothetical protein